MTSSPHRDLVTPHRDHGPRRRDLVPPLTVTSSPPPLRRDPQVDTSSPDWARDPLPRLFALAAAREQERRRRLRQRPDPQPAAAAGSGGLFS